MFPEKIEIFEGQCRTKRLNSAVASILLEISEIKDKKKGQNRKKSSLSRLVEITGDYTNFSNKDLVIITKI